MEKITITLTQADLYLHPEYAQLGGVGTQVDVTVTGAVQPVVGSRPDDRH